MVFYSHYSNVASPEGTYQIIPADPTNCSAVLHITSKEIHISWELNDDNEVLVSLERMVMSGESIIQSWGQYALLPARTVSHVDYDVNQGFTYYYRVKAIGEYGNSDYSNIAYVLADVPSSIPALTAIAISDIEIDLMWTAVDNAGLYVIERSNDGINGWLQIDTTLNTSYADITCAATTSYYYRVKAVNHFGSSGYSNIANATTFLLNSPFDLVVVSSAPNSISIRWEYASSSDSTEEGYRIQRQPYGGGDWTEVGTTNKNVYVFTNNGLDEYTSYNYRVQAYNSGGISNWSNVATGKSKLIAPTNLTLSVEPGTGSTVVNVSWSNTSTHATHVVIERSDAVDGTYDPISISPVELQVTHCQDYVLPSSHWWYRIKNIVDSDSSSYAGPLDIEVTSGMPAAPTNLVATQSVYPNQGVRLDWVNNCSDAIFNEIKRVYNGVEFTWQVSGSVASAADVNVVENGVYSYWVRAYNNDYSDWSNVATISCVLEINPTDLSATYVAETDTVHLTWVDNSSTESNYKVFRSATGNAGDYYLYATLPADSQEFDDTNPLDNINYYMVAASNWVGDAFSNPANVLVPLDPPALLDSDLSGVNFTTSTVQIQAGSDYQTGFIVQRRVKTTGSWVNVGSVSGTYSIDDIAFCDILSPADGKWYEYRAKAINDINSSAWSNIIDFKAIGSCTPPTITHIYPYLMYSYLTYPNYGFYMTYDPTDVNGDGVEGAKYDQGSWNNLGANILGSAQAFCANEGIDSFVYGTTYSYKLKAYQEWNGHRIYSNYSDVVQGIYQTFAPSNLNPAVVSPTQVDLDWVDNYTGEHAPSDVEFNFWTRFDDVEVQMSTNGTDWTPYTTNATYPSLGTFAWNGPVHVVSLAPATEYWFRIRSTVRMTGVWSGWITTSIKTPIPVVTNAHTTGSTTTSIDLAWTSVGSGIYYHIQKSTGENGPWTDVGDTSIDQTTYTAIGLDHETTYYFRIQSRKSGYSPSDYSNVCSAATGPLAPSNLLVAQNGIFEGEYPSVWTSHILTWTLNSSEEDSVEIWSKLVNKEGDVSQDWSFIIGLPSNTTSWSPDSWYRSNEGFLVSLRVRVNKNGLMSDFSNVVSYYVPSPLPLVSLNGTPTTTTIPLSLYNYSSMPITINIYRSTEPNPLSWSIVHSLVNPSYGVNLWTDSNLGEGSAYYYKTDTTNVHVSSPMNNSTFNAFTKLPLPTGFAATANADGKFLYSWELHSSAQTAIQIERQIVRKSDGYVYQGWSDYGYGVDSYPNQMLLTSHVGSNIENYYGYEQDSKLQFRARLVNHYVADYTDYTPIIEVDPIPYAQTYSLLIVNPTTNSLDVNWLGNSPLATKVNIYRSTTPDPLDWGPPIHTHAGTSGIWTDTGLQPGTTYYYRTRMTDDSLSREGFWHDESGTTLT